MQKLRFVYKNWFLYITNTNTYKIFFWEKHIRRNESKMCMTNFCASLQHFFRVHTIFLSLVYTSMYYEYYVKWIMAMFHTKHLTQLQLIDEYFFCIKESMKSSEVVCHLRIWPEIPPSVQSWVIHNLNTANKHKFWFILHRSKKLSCYSTFQ